jgi:hypothetical protein
VKIFVDGNLEKRFEKLQAQLEFVADGFDRFDDLIADYIRARPSAAYDTGISDGERMLVWLTETKGLSQNPTDARNVRGDSNQRRGFRIDTKTLSPEQLDYIACQRARHAIEETARQHRLKHVHFQELVTLTKVYREELVTNRHLLAYLNPIRTWGRFVSSALLDDDTAPPADVLFFPVREEISTAVLELEGQAMINDLADFQPCTLDEWSGLSELVDRDGLVELSRDLAELSQLLAVKK